MDPPSLASGASGQPALRHTTRRRRPRRLIQLAFGFVSMVCLVAIALYVSRDPGAAPAASSAPAIEHRWPLPARALNLGDTIGASNLALPGPSLMTALRRSVDVDERSEVGRAVKAVVEPFEPRTVEPIEEVPPPPLLTDDERLARLEATSPQLANQVDRFEWARVPDEWPLFRVFDETDANVVPPGTKGIPLRADLRLVLASGFQGEGKAQLQTRIGGEADSQIGMVEVTISERGAVERARLISVPNSIHGSMLLSVIKAWQFTPATKDGQPVRYRQVIPIIAAR